MIKNLKLAKINSGTSTHLAKHFVTVNGVTGYNVYCGSGKTGFRNQLRNVVGEVTAERITCKKCRKAYEEQYANKTNEELNAEVLKDYQDTKAYAESIGTTFKLNEELEKELQK